MAVTPPSQQELLPSPGAWAEASQCFTDWTTCLARRQTGKQAQARQREEQAAEEADKEARAALAKHGMDKAVASPEKRKRGRPPGAKTSWRAVPGLRKKRAEVSAAGKLSLVQELKKMETATHRQHLRRHYKVSQSFASRPAKPSGQERLADFVQMRSLGKTGLRQQGSLDAVARPRPKTPGATLGKTDRHRQVWTQTALWAQLQEAGHQLSMEDVLDDFEERLHKAVSVRQTQADKGLASPEELKELEAWKQKQDSLANKPKQRAKFKIKLMSRCAAASKCSSHPSRRAMWRLGSWTGRTPGSQCQIRRQSG